MSGRVPQLLTSSNRTVSGIFPACYSMQRRECSIDIASMAKKAIRTPPRVFSPRARMVPHRSSIQRLLAGPTAIGAASISKAKSSTKCMLGRLRGQERGRRPHRELETLAGLGITVLEVMPVADFTGSFGWGYDGVDLYAPTRLYGTPDDFRRFVDRAHRTGLAVILDVVYNHFGPDGAYFTEFSDHYFTDRYENEWGKPINFDGKNSAPVREFIIANAGYWIDEFHIDGLRLDATQQIFDATSPHVLAEITRGAREAAHGAKYNQSSQKTSPSR